MSLNASNNQSSLFPSDHLSTYSDVISHESNSYFTDAHEVLVHVGPVDEVSPPLPMAKRMRVKAPSQEMKEHDAANGRELVASQIGACSSELRRRSES